MQCLWALCVLLFEPRQGMCPMVLKKVEIKGGERGNLLCKMNRLLYLYTGFYQLLTRKWGQYHRVLDTILRWTYCNSASNLHIQVQCCTCSSVGKALDAKVVWRMLWSDNIDSQQTFQVSALRQSKLEESSLFPTPSSCRYSYLSVVS